MENSVCLTNWSLSLDVGLKDKLVDNLCSHPKMV